MLMDRAGKYLLDQLDPDKPARPDDDPPRLTLKALEKIRMSRSRERILANLDEMYREAFERAKATDVQPRVRGGDRSEGNLVTACMGCNTRKGHQRLSEFLHAESAARRSFFQRANHVWPRFLRDLEHELADLDAAPQPMKKA
jgi:hypothetical protein